MSIEELIESMVEIRLKEPDDFLKIKETLTRIGVASKSGNKLFQSCHILHKRQKYYITHFKELFALDGRETTFDETDIARRNTIINLLSEWDLLEVVDPNKTHVTAPLSNIKILPFSQKGNWSLEAKYTIGRKL